MYYSVCVDACPMNVSLFNKMNCMPNSQITTCPYPNFPHSTVVGYCVPSGEAVTDVGMLILQ
jgi:hypothetical protein